MRVLRAVLGAVVFALFGAGCFLAAPKARPPATEQIAQTKERVERGRYLAEHVTGCLHCHSEMDPARWGMAAKPGTAGAGGACWDEKMGVPGIACATNLTPDPETGLGKWTDGEILRAMREGVSRDGHALFALMPYALYREMSDEDAMSVVAYLRTLAPVRRAVPARNLKFPMSMIVNFMPKPVEQPVAEPNRADPVKYGRYLATIGGCGECHTPQDDHHEPIAAQAYWGGREFPLPGGVVRSPNLTPDVAGLGAMTQQTFVSRFQSNAAPENAERQVDPAKNTVMGWQTFAGMTAEDLGAIYAYLRTLPKSDNLVEIWPTP